MQIAMRENQPRLDVAIGSRSTSQPTIGHPFDELVRAVGARDSRAEARSPVEDRAAPEIREPSVREPVEIERPRHDHRERETTDREPVRGQTVERQIEEPERLETERGTDPAAEPAQETETAAAVPTGEDGDADADVTASPGAASENLESAEATTIPTQTVEQKVASLPAIDIGTRTPGANTATISEAAGQARPDVIPRPRDDAIAVGKLRVAAPLLPALAAGSTAGQLPGTQGQGLPTTLLAQSLGQTPAAPALAIAAAPANGQAATAIQTNGTNASSAKAKAAIAANAAPGKGATAEATPNTDFKAVAAAILGQAGAGRGAAAAPGLMVDAASTTASAPTAPGGVGIAAGESHPQSGRTEAASATHQSTRLTGPQFAERIGLTIARAADAGVDRVSIRLNPREMGRIDVRMDLGADGRMQLHVMADKPDTLDQLQRNMRDLERSLSDAGFDTGAGDLNFSLRQQNPHNDRDGSGQGGYGGSDAETDSDPLAADTEDGLIITHQSDDLMVVDLFV